MGEDGRKTEEAVGGTVNLGGNGFWLTTLYGVAKDAVRTFKTGGGAEVGEAFWGIDGERSLFYVFQLLKSEEADVGDF